MSDTKQQDQQGVTRPGLKPFVRPQQAQSPVLQPMAPAFGRVTLPPFGPIRYGGPKPGAAVVTPSREDDEAPTWASIEEYVHTAATPEVADVAEPEPQDDTGLFAEEPPQQAETAAPSPPWLDAAPAEPEPEPAPEPEAERDPEPEPELLARRPALPLTGPYDPTPIMNPTIERTTEPHRMTPMRVTPLRSHVAISPTAVPAEPNARAVAAALEMVAARVRRGELVVPGSMPANDDPPALAAVLAATVAALLGVRT
jgi:outer membrane biosynthesis protein TonB